MEKPMVLKKLLSTAATLGTLAIGGLAVSSLPAGAYVACNHDGDCWHTEDRTHAPGVRFDYHPDDWYFHRDWDRDRDHHWRGYHEGRGYWRGGVWITL
jgi:hypothetical protein